jgi:hypothetical protein
MAINLPDPVLEATKSGKCVLFVGSGLSGLAGYPTWGELVMALVEEAKKAPQANTQGLEKLIEENNLLLLAEFARSTLGVSQFAQILRKKLSSPAKPSDAHRAIAKTKYRGFITTNYDRLLETTLTLERGWAENPITPESVSSLGSALYEPSLFIFKLHGDIAAPESIILTSRDYDRLIMRNPHVRSFLQAIFLTYTLLFVGYGLRDPDFNLILRELNVIFEGYTPTHYALLSDVPGFASHHLVHDMSIQTVVYDPHDNHQEVVEALQHLQKIAPYDAEP